VEEKTITGVISVKIVLRIFEDFFRGGGVVLKKKILKLLFL